MVSLVSRGTPRYICVDTVVQCYQQDLLKYNWTFDLCRTVWFITKLFICRVRFSLLLNYNSNGFISGSWSCNLPNFESKFGCSVCSVWLLCFVQEVVSFSLFPSHPQILSSSSTQLWDKIWLGTRVIVVYKLVVQNCRCPVFCVCYNWRGYHLLGTHETDVIWQAGIYSQRAQSKEKGWLL